MRNGIVFVCSGVILSLAVAAVTVSGSERGRSQIVKAGGSENGTALSERFRPKMRNALRIRTDAARGRLWVLTLDDVRVYDAGSKRLIRKVVLPSWSMARFICAPDMVLDGSGAAIVSSNVLARLWRIDANSFEVSAHEIRLQEREHWDVGFGALAFAADGTLFALTAAAVSLWKIDVAKASASMIELNGPPLRGCAFTTQFLNDFERSRKPWTRPSLHQN